MADILDSTDFCSKCGGSGVVLKDCRGMWGQKQMLKCDQCCRFDSDDEAVEAAERLIHGTYANNRRAHELDAGLAEMLIESCEECPCCYLDISEVGHPHEHHCSLLKQEVFVYINKIDKSCPLKTKTYILRAPSQEEPMTGSDDMTGFEIQTAMGSPRSGWTVDERLLGHVKTSWLEQFRKQNREVLVKVVDIRARSKMLMCSHGIHRGDYCSECKGTIGEET